MASTVYFDTSVFLDILGGKQNAAEIRQLLAELKEANTKIYTSIITAQEVSVLSYRRGTAARDLHRKVARIARMQSIDLDIALTAAKIEAGIADSGKEKESSRQQKKRRKWDCFHLATAIKLECSAFYSTDDDLLKAVKAHGPSSLVPALPKPTQGTLALKAGAH